MLDYFNDQLCSKLCRHKIRMPSVSERVHVSVSECVSEGIPLIGGKTQMESLEEDVRLLERLIELIGRRDGGME